MDKDKQERLEAAGWRIGTAAEFLGLLPEQEILLEIKFALFRQLPQDTRLPTTTSLETLILEVLKTGMSVERIGEIIAQVTPQTTRS